MDFYIFVNISILRSRLGFAIDFTDPTDGCQHYENMPMQYTEIFKVVKNENYQ